MNIAICEDNIEELNIIDRYIDNWSKKNDIKVNIDKYQSSESFLFEWTDCNKYDIIFLDIKMKKISGIELANLIREKNKDVAIVFITGMVEYVLYGYKVGAIQYLLKPINQDDIYSCLNKVLDRINSIDKLSQFMVIKGPKEDIRLRYSEIYYFEMFTPNITIYTIKEQMTLRKTISEIEEELKCSSFIRCHRSYIVNLEYVKSISKDTIVLENGISIPLSRNRYKEVSDQFINYLCGTK